MVAKTELKLEVGKLYKLTSSNGKVLLDNQEVVVYDAITANRIHRLGWCLGHAVTENELSIMFYASTHTHSHYSVLDGMNRIKDLSEVAVGAMALTDHGTMSGTLAFQKAMRSQKKHPILGCEVYMREEGEKGYSHLVLLAKTEQGLKNLVKITSYSFNHMYRGKGMVSRALLEKYHEGLICTSACVSGEIAKACANNDLKQAEELVSYYKNLFQDDFYIEIQKHGFQLENQVNPLLVNLARTHNIKLIAGIDSHWTSVKDVEAHDVLLCVNDGKRMTEAHRTFDGSGYHILSQEEAYNVFEDIPEALLSTLEVVMKCNALYTTGVYYNPTFEFIPEGFENDAEYMRYLAKMGYEDRVVNAGKDSEEYRKRLEYELEVILNMGYASYFLIVNEYVQWAKNNDIGVGPGRGSAAGSLVAYCLYIVDLDPMKYGLLFERFLNPARVSMPDIDMDFEDSKRELVIDHVKQLYGEERVSNIITFGTMATKRVIQDVCRAYDKAYLSSKITSLIPNGVKNLKGAMAENPELQSLYDTDYEVRDLMDVAFVLEGNIRNLSTHACGIVIAPSDVSDYLPMCRIGNEKGGYANSTQFTMTEVEEMGILKFDFLGLKTMGVIVGTVKSIQSLADPHAQSVKHYLDIPLNDPYVYKEISFGTSFAVFQIESAGMRSFMKQLYQDVSKRIAQIEDKYGLAGFGNAICGSGSDYIGYQKEMSAFGDECFDRLIAGVAMYRPGPMEFIPNYIEGMMHPERIVYDCDEIIPIVKSTYGVICYQEQVMEIVRVLAGFSMSQADDIRKAMGKKKEEILVEYREYFIYGSDDALDSHTGKPLNIQGCVDRGVSEEVAIRIWDKMKDFAKYAFNKSHAAAYAFVAIECAWLKHYFPAHYMCAALNTYILDDRFKAYIEVTKKMGIVILKADVNISEELFTVNENGDLIFGLRGLKGCNNAVAAIIQARQNGLFLDVQDFTERTGADRKMLESLIYSGALDSFAGSRKAKLMCIDAWLEASKSRNKDLASGQMSFLDLDESFLGDSFKDAFKVTVPLLPEMDKMTMLSKEKEFAGLYITAHPLDEYAGLISQNQVGNLSFLVDRGVNDEQVFGDKVEEPFVLPKGSRKVAGLITNFKVIYTKRDHKPMAFFTIEDQYGEIDAVIFPDSYHTYRNMLDDGAVVVLSGNFAYKEEDVQFIVDSVMSMEALGTAQLQKQLYVKVENQAEYTRLETVVSRHKGEHPVKFQYNKKVYACRVSGDNSASLIMELEESFGRSNVILA